MQTQVYFGEAKKSKVDWRTVLVNEVDPDDELLSKTPKDVIDLLGFDPLELEVTVKGLSALIKQR
jgi:hypothetical protein